MNKHFGGSISHSASANKKLIIFKMAYLYVVHTDEGEFTLANSLAACTSGDLTEVAHYLLSVYMPPG